MSSAPSTHEHGRSPSLRLSVRLGHRAVIASTEDPDVFALLRAAFRFARGHGEVADVVSVTHEGNGFRVRANGHDERASSLLGAARLARAQVLRSVVSASPERLWLHAAAVAGRRGAILVVGPGGSGKSTFAAALCARGLRYMSDELVGIDLLEGTVLGLPVAPAARVTPVEGPTRLADLSKVVIHLPAHSVRQAPAPPRLVLFPRYSALDAPRICQVSPAHGAAALLENGLNLPALGDVAARTAASLARSVRLLSLTYRDAADALRLLMDACRSAAGAPE